jgi:hypothetical protein
MGDKKNSLASHTFKVREAGSKQTRKESYFQNPRKKLFGKHWPCLDCDSIPYLTTMEREMQLSD